MQRVVALANFSDKSVHSLMPSILHEAFKSMKMRINDACNKAIKLDYPHSTTLPVNWKEHNSDWLNRAFVGDTLVPSKFHIASWQRLSPKFHFDRARFRFIVGPAHNRWGCLSIPNRV